MELSIWENILLGAMIFGIMVWMRPSLKSSMKISENSQSDWKGFLMPIGFVVLFVCFLLAMV